MNSDRLVVLLPPEEKARLVALARARRSSVGALVRGALSALNDPKPSEPRSDMHAGSPEAPLLPPEQAAALEPLAEVALQTMQRASAALEFRELDRRLSRLEGIVAARATTPPTSGSLPPPRQR